MKLWDTDQGIVQDISTGNYFSSPRALDSPEVFFLKRGNKSQQDVLECSKATFDREHMLMYQPGPLILSWEELHKLFPILPFLNDTVTPLSTLRYSSF